jgi:hypothetical protein
VLEYLISGLQLKLKIAPVAQARHLHRARSGRFRKSSVRVRYFAS